MPSVAKVTAIIAFPTVHVSSVSSPRRPYEVLQSEEPSRACSFADRDVCLRTKNDPHHLFVITGPTGVGKTRIIWSLSESFSCGADAVPMVIDDLVQNDPDYKARVKKHLQHMCPSLDCPRVDPNKEDYKWFDKAYYGARRLWGCSALVGGSNRTCARCEAAWACDRKFELDLRQAFQRKQDVFFEMTGVTPPSWPVGVSKAEAPSNTEYTVIVAIGYVDFCTLLKRNRGRSAVTTKAFLADETGSVKAPRYPDMDLLPKKVTQIIEQAERTLDCVAQLFDAKSPGGCDRISEYRVYHTAQEVLEPFVVRAPANSQEVGQAKQDAEKAKSMLRTMRWNERTHCEIAH